MIQSGVWVCPKGIHEVGYVEMIIPGLSSWDFPNPGYDNGIPVGNMTVFGDGYSGPARSVWVTRKLFVFYLLCFLFVVFCINPLFALIHK